MDELGIRRYCCRRMLLSDVFMLDHMLRCNVVSPVDTKVDTEVDTEVDAKVDTEVDAKVDAKVETNDG